ncbi:MAG: invasion associated locus B family protein [Pseudomonadota bacterium]
MAGVPFTVRQPGGRPAPKAWIARAGMAATLACALPQAAMAQNQTEVRDTSGDWNIECVVGTDNCLMSQIGKTAQGEDALRMSVRALKGVTAQNGETLPAAINFLAPLGVAIGAGLTVQVDSKQQRRGGYEVCLRNGCVVSQPIDDAFLNELKNGNTAKITFLIVQGGSQSGTQTTPVDINISLRGFTRAFGQID